MQQILADYLSEPGTITALLAVVASIITAYFAWRKSQPSPGEVEKARHQAAEIEAAITKNLFASFEQQISRLTALVQSLEEKNTELTRQLRTVEAENRTLKSEIDDLRERIGNVNLEA